MAHIEKLRHEDIMFLHDEWIQNDIELVAEFLKGFLFMLPAPICIATRVDLCSIAWIVWRFSKHGFHPLLFIEADMPMDHLAIDLKKFCKFGQVHYRLCDLFDARAARWCK